MSKSNKMSRYPHDAKVYVGDLGSSASKQDLERAFSYYGELRSVWVARNPPGFAFVEFEDERDAKDAVRGLDGRIISGRRVRVELSTGKSARSAARGSGGGGRRGRSRGREDRCYECGKSGHFARDCRRRRRRSRSGRSRSRSRSNYRTRSRSYSRSPKRSSRSPRRSRSPKRGDSRAGSKSPPPRRDVSRSRSRSMRDDRSNRSQSNRSRSQGGRDSRSRSQSRDSRNGED